MSTERDLTGKSEMWVQRNYNRVQGIPHHDAGEFAGEDLPKAAQHAIQALLIRGLIEKTGTEYAGTGRQRHTHNTYRATRKLDSIRATIEKPTLPCGHTGLTNHGNGEYGCGHKYCERVYDRETVEEVYG